MRYYIPPGALDAREKEVLRRLRPKSITLIVGELSEPTSIPTVRKVLRSRDPEAAIASEIAKEVGIATRQAVRGLQHGLGDYDVEDAGLAGFKKFRKRLRKKLVKMLPKPLRKIHEKIGKVGKKVWKKYGKVIVAVVGVVLSIAIPGIGTAIGVVLSTAHAMYEKKRAAAKMKKINAAESARLDAEVAQQEQKLTADLDKLYGENAASFEAAGITRDKWAALTIDQKLAVIEKFNKGEIPVTSPAIIDQAVADGTVPQPPPPPPDWMNVIQGADIYREALAAEQQRPIEPSLTPSITPEGREKEPKVEAPPAAAPAGKYELYVEGEKVFETTDSNEMFNKVGQVTKTGDRFEVFLNGKSLGLKIRTAGGVISVPPEGAEKVRAMSHGEVRAMVARAAAAAKGEGKPEEAAGGIPWWLVAGGAAAAIAAVA